MDKTSQHEGSGDLLPGLLRLKEGDKQNKLHNEGSKTKDAYLTDEES